MVSPGSAVVCIAPAVLAFLLLALVPGAKRFRRRGLLMAVSGLTAVLGAALMLLVARPTQGRVVFVLDSDELLARDKDGLGSLARQYTASGMESCDVLVIGGAAPAEKGACPIPEGLSARAWRSPTACASLTHSDAMSAHDPDCALQIAAQRLAPNGWLDSSSDLVRGRSRRIAVVASQPKRWAQSWLVDAKARLSELAPASVAVDLVHPGDDAPTEQTPSLTLRVSPPRFPERRVDGTLELQVASPALADHVGETLDATTRCDIDRLAVSGFRFNSTDSRSMKDLFVVQSAGVAVRKEPVRLRDFEPVGASGSPRELVRGFHLVECTVSLRLPGGRELPAATAAQYLDVGPRYFLLVAGQARAFAHDDYTPASNDDIRALWEAGARRAGGDLAFGGLVPEATFRASGLGEGVSPAVLVLHDLTAETWEARCADLERLVTSGTTLLVSGAPPRSLAGICGFLPAFAKDEGKVTVQVDRRPRVTFMLDPSRLGNLRHRPQAGTRAFAPHGFEPSSSYNLAPLADGLALQREVARRICDALRAADEAVDCSVSGLPSGPRLRFLQARTLPAPFPEDATKAMDESKLRRASQLDRRLSTLLDEAPTPGVVRPNDVLVLFTYDVNQPPSASQALTTLLSRGVHVYVVPVSTPYAGALRVQGAGDALANVLSKARGSARAMGTNAVASSVFAPYALAERLRADRQWTLDLAAPTPDADAARVGDALGAELRGRLMPDATLVVVNRRGRFVDERVGTFLREGTSPRWQTRPADAFAAPLRFQVLEPNDQAQSSRWLSAIPAPGLNEGAPLTLPLAFGGVHGRGEILVLGYSLFEGLSGTFFETAPWRSQAAFRTVLPGPEDASDAWGPRRVVDTVKFQAALEPGPGDEPRIVGARVVDASGRIEVDVVQRIRAGGGIEGLELVGCRSGGFSGACLPPEGSSAVAGRVVGLDTVAQRLTYAFAPTDLESVCGGPEGCTATLKRTAGSAPEASDATDEVRLFVPRSRTEATGAIADVPVLETMRLLAVYSGGGEVRAGGEPPVHRQPVRPPIVLAILALFIAYWALRLAQRWGTARTLRIAARRQVGLIANTDARGAVHSAGEALGRPQSTLRVGAFAGFRPFEPGDRLSAAVREDVLFYARQRANGETARIPRVARHVEEVGRHVRVIVNVGMSMRTPGARRGDAAKLSAVAKVCDLVAEVGWRFRSTIEVVPIGLRRAGEVLGPLGSPGASGAVAAHVLAEGRKAARWTTRYELPEHDRPMSVVLVSDFLNEDLAGLARFAADVEEEGGLFGAIHVHTPAELLLLGAGVAPAQGMLCDRMSWSPEEARLAHEQFCADLDVALGGYAGGLLSISAELSLPEVLAVLSEGPLLRVLR